MGSGKSTIGQKLSRKLGFTFVDLDSEIESRTGMAVQELFDRHGEEFFREQEHRALNAVAGLKDAVVATGGGTPCYFDHMTLMNDTGMTVYIRMPAAALARRLADARTRRPVLAGIPGDRLEEEIVKLLSVREPFYRRAGITVDGINADVDKLATMILGKNG